MWETCILWIAAAALIAAAIFALVMILAVNAAFGPAKKNFIARGVSGDMESADRTIQLNKKKEEAEVKRWQEKKKIRRVTHTMADGSLHSAWELEPAKFSGQARQEGQKKSLCGESHNWVLLLHGYRSSGSALLGLAIPYAKEGWHCLAPDTRAQGESGGRWITFGVREKEDCREWIREILQKDPEAEILLHGRSMGGCTALMLAADCGPEDHVKGVISDSSPSTAWVMFDRKLTEWTGIKAGRLLYIFDFFMKKQMGISLWDCSPILTVSKIKMPVLLFHGSGDRLVPADMAYRLYNHLRSPRKLMIIDGAGHVQAQEKNPSLFWNTIKDWMEENHLYGREKAE